MEYEEREERKKKTEKEKKEMREGKQRMRGEGARAGGIRWWGRAEDWKEEEDIKISEEDGGRKEKERNRVEGRNSETRCEKRKCEYLYTVKAV